jgi:hypothetical protein
MGREWSERVVSDKLSFFDRVGLRAVTGRELFGKKRWD